MTAAQVHPRLTTVFENQTGVISFALFCDRAEADRLAFDAEARGEDYVVIPRDDGPAYVFARHLMRQDGLMCALCCPRMASFLLSLVCTSCPDAKVSTSERWAAELARAGAGLAFGAAAGPDAPAGQ